MQKWRLLIVSEPGRDGVFVIIRHLISYLHANHPEIEVDYAYSSVRGDEPLRDFVKTVEAWGGETVDLQVGNAPQKNDIAAIGKIRDLVRRRGHKLVHAHSSKAGALARFCALTPGFPPVIYHPHAYFGMPKKGGVKELVFNILESVLGRIGLAVNCSEDEYDFARQTLHVPERFLRLIHNGIDLEKFHPVSPERKAELRKALNIPPDGRLLITVGRYSYQKNHAELYAAVDHVLPQGGWRFAHAGAGAEELQAGLSPEAKARCHFFTFLPNPIELIQAADVFILPSRYEGLSVAMLEALGCGLPMILSAAPGLRVLKLLGFTEVKWLSDPADRSVTPEIVEVLQTWQDETLAEARHQLALTHQFFDAKVQSESLVSLYEERRRS